MHTWFPNSQRECPQVQRQQTKRQRLRAKRWLKRGDLDAPEPRLRSSQGWVTW